MTGRDHDSHIEDHYFLRSSWLWSSLDRQAVEQRDSPDQSTNTLV